MTDAMTDDQEQFLTELDELVWAEYEQTLDEYCLPYSVSVDFEKPTATKVALRLEAKRRIESRITYASPLRSCERAPEALGLIDMLMNHPNSREVKRGTLLTTKGQES